MGKRDVRSRSWSRVGIGPFPRLDVEESEWEKLREVIR